VRSIRCGCVEVGGKKGLGDSSELARTLGDTDRRRGDEGRHSPAERGRETNTRTIRELGDVTLNC
jgi:hypothetical protein